MNYKEIESYFVDDSKLEKLLELLVETFDRINYYSTLFRDRIVMENPREIETALSELTGLYMFLKPIVSIAITEKKNREERYYNQRKIEIENEGKKFMSAPVEREASDYVSNYRRVRNILQGYLDVCDKAISTCQSLLKSIGAEIK